MTAAQALQAYVERYFVRRDELARLANVPESRIAALIAARAIPIPIYTLWPNGAFSSPIGGQHGAEPRGEPVHWYAPASAWWIRRGAGLAPEQAATAFAARFTADFVTCLQAEPQGPIGYPGAYRDGRFDPEAAAEIARAEWQDWIDGGYGVCLRHADARHAITKTCRRSAVLAITDAGRLPALSADQREALLSALEELDSVMLPFAPHQRPHGTPGLWLDAMLARYGLGTTREAAAPGAVPQADRICA